MTHVLLYYPNLIGYARVVFVMLSFYLAYSSWQLSMLFYTLAFTADAIDGYVARLMGQSSKFGAVLDMVTDRCSTAGLLCILATLWKKEYAIVFIGLMFLDLFSHWMHVISVAGTGHHKGKDTLQGRNFILRWYYGNFYFFAYCCVFTEFFYIGLYLLHFNPDASLELSDSLRLSLREAVLFVCLPACCVKQFTNFAQLSSAALCLAKEDMESSQQKTK